METVTIVSTANAGMMLMLGNRKILIDAFHSKQYDIYSCVSPELFRQIKEDPDFSEPDLCIYTHCHPDHFSAEMANETALLWPDMLTILPEDQVDGTVLSDEEETIHYGAITLSFARLPHESVDYADVPHYGVLIHYEGLTILDTGDCEIASEKLIDFVFGKKIDLAILNFPWLTLRRGRQFVKDVIRPKHIVIAHLPDRKRDTFGFEKALEDVVKREFSDQDVRILTHPLQKETIIVE